MTADAGPTQREVGELLSDQFENLEDGSHVATVLNEKASGSK